MHYETEDIPETHHQAEVSPKAERDSLSHEIFCVLLFHSFFTGKLDSPKRKNKSLDM